MIPTFFIIYITCWIIACLIALSLLFFYPQQVDLLNKHYWQLLFQPWKLITWFIATMGLVLIAPYTGDMTWDYFDASMMALLTFLTAPWVVAVLYRVLFRQCPLWQAYVAICVWLFSASWCYDLYLLIRDGYYPITWFSNIFASSVLYLSAGLLWSLESVPSRGIIFGFMEKSWPNVNHYTPFKQIMWFAFPFMLIATVAILFFVI